MKLDEQQAKEYLQSYLDPEGPFRLHHTDPFTNRRYLVSRKKMIRRGETYEIYVEIRRYTGFDPYLKRQTHKRWGMPAWYIRKPGELFQDSRKSLNEAIRLLSTAELED